MLGLVKSCDSEGCNESICKYERPQVSHFRNDNRDRIQARTGDAQRSESLSLHHRVVLVTDVMIPMKVYDKPSARQPPDALLR